MRSSTRWALITALLILAFVGAPGMLYAKGGGGQAGGTIEQAQAAMLNENVSPTLRIEKHATDEIKGSYGRAGSFVAFSAKHSGSQQDQTDENVAQVTINGVILEATQNRKTGKVQYTGYNKALFTEHKAALVGLMDELDVAFIGLKRGLLPQEDFLVRFISYFAEAPVGYPIGPKESGNSTPRYLTSPVTTGVTQNCQGEPAGPPTGDRATSIDETVYVSAFDCDVYDDDGLTYLDCSTGYKSQSHDAPNELPAESHCFLTYDTYAGPNSGNCKGKCGGGCGWQTATTGYTQDCLDHDECGQTHGGSTDPYDPSCGDEWGDADDDFFNSWPNC